MGFHTDDGTLVFTGKLNAFKDNGDHVKLSLKNEQNVEIDMVYVKPVLTAGVWTWTWDRTGSKLVDGKYTLDASIVNGAGTQVSDGSAKPTNVDKLATNTSPTMTIKPPQVDTVRFTPMATEKRVLNEPKVKYLVRADGFEYCARITGIPVTPTSRPMACAFWNVRRKECTIVTPLTTGFNYLGHELRHCFEGAFHD